ncbi:hypothetical protein FTO74_07735 [Granulicella sp. WH15]|uniref:hypothetical protein n=1 Tax=Granulicella sp. WH15 TaxID=2602070 RepID=UPI001366F761|nr:hypothetical protein [Granulicella sp. WH15]QHN03268.1 hypothetical protein FTO74_07735 [Granulicella sp. WH15]
MSFRSEAEESASVFAVAVILAVAFVLAVALAAALAFAVALAAALAFAVAVAVASGRLEGIHHAERVALAVAVASGVGPSFSPDIQTHHQRGL